VAIEGVLRGDLPGGVIVVRHPSVASRHSIANEPLYQRAAARLSERGTAITLTFIPDYASANREPQPMVLWVPPAPRVAE
jgi:hypothetical protein